MSGCQRFLKSQHCTHWTWLLSCHNSAHRILEMFRNKYYSFFRTKMAKFPRWWVSYHFYRVQRETKVQSNTVNVLVEVIQGISEDYHRKTHKCSFPRFSATQDPGKRAYTYIHLSNYSSINTFNSVFMQMMQSYRNKITKLIFNFLLINVLKQKSRNLHTYINVIDILVTATHLQVHQFSKAHV